MSEVSFLTLDETEALVQRVVATVSAAVTSTMGPNGKLSLIAVGTSTKVTKDGVTVAKAIKFNDPRMELINKVIVEPAIKTDLECGDGTTTTIFLTAVLYQVFKDYPGYRDQKFIEGFINRVITKLEELSIQVNTDDPRLKQLALITSNGDEELATVITDIYAKSEGTFPEIELKEGYENVDKVIPSDGIPLQMVFSNPGFSQYGNGAETNFDSFYAVVVDETIRAKDVDQFMRTLGELHTYCDKNIPILIIARSIEHDYNALFVQASVASKCPFKRFIGIQTNMGGSVGSLLMGDIATVLNTQMFTRFEDIQATELKLMSGEVLTVGSSRSLLEVTSAKTTARINRRVQEIQQELSSYDMGARFSQRFRFNEKRIRNLNGRLTTIFVGGETSSEVKERLDRFEDVIKAVKSALVNGILPGVGTSLRKACDIAEIEYTNEGLVNNTSKADILGNICYALEGQYTLLMEGLIDPARIQDEDNSIMNSSDWVNSYPVMNLATGEIGTAEELGIYDTAYASITALKGGLQTAKILANTRSLLLGDKLASVKLQ